MWVVPSGSPHTSYLYPYFIYYVMNTAPIGNNSRQQLTQHGLKRTYYGKQAHITENKIRFRQKAVKRGGRFVTLRIARGVEYVMMYET